MDILKQLTNCEILSTVTQEQDEEQWVKNRMLGIGGSDVGSICGVNKYSSARLTYLIKTGQYENDFSEEAKERMAWGHKLEPVVADEFVLRTGKKVAVSPATLKHKDHPWALANVDRFIMDDEDPTKIVGVLECKTADSRLNKLWEEGEPPTSYIYQLMWYLWITDLKYGAFAALVGGNKFYHIEVFRNDELLENEIVPAVSKFWNYNVKNLIPPEISGTDADTEYVSETYVDVEAKSEIFLEEEDHNELAADVIMYKTKIKEFEWLLAEAQNKLKDALGNNEIGKTLDYTIKWSPRSRAGVDSALLKSEYPEIYEAVKKTSRFRVMTVK